ncbi:MAG: nucleotidyltransferase domain-containing protein [Candidatus Aminicenantes bacterium]|nr:nucleotidyltransferase domain-containing protein [Candidatus Aminicenantes bacterium]
MRIDRHEKEALKYAFKDFKGDVYFFGSRLDDSKKGGDIDVIIIPGKKANPLKLSLEIQKRFFSKCEQNLDLIVYKEDNLFCREVMSHAKRVNIETI